MGIHSEHTTHNEHFLNEQHFLENNWLPLKTTFYILSHIFDNCNMRYIVTFGMETPKIFLEVRFCFGLYVLE